ncbi:MAG: DUF6384 family protein [Filomicrobium sp.]
MEDQETNRSQNADQPSDKSQPKKAGTVGGKSPLDDIMIAMDVVDTLRHDEGLVARELNDEARRKDLIDRLRDIYRGQGIEVPDRILEEGVAALEGDRFTYTPPDPDAISTRLARLYVSRWSWGKYVLGLVAGIAAFFLVNYAVFERPEQMRAETEQRELATILPKRLAKLKSDIASEATDPLIAARADGIAKSGLNAASSGDAKTARKSSSELSEMLRTLRTSYDIRVINRQGELSGLWRVPDANPDTYNFYLVVEAVDPDGNVLEQMISNEETGKSEKVSTWAVRVDRSVLQSVKADKDDDGIIQDNIVGRKERGLLEPDWTIPVKGGTITRWK